MTKPLITHLSEKYSISEDRLRKYIFVDKEVIDIFRPDDIHNELETKQKSFRDEMEEHTRAYYHVAVRGDKDIVHLGYGGTFGGGVKSYDVCEFMALFPNMILFVVPLYGIYELGDNLDIQRAIKTFAVDFGKRVGKEVMVFDYWIEESFDTVQYELQEKHIIDTFNISEAKLPSILISNRSPYAWDEADDSKKMVILSFRNYPLSELGTSLRKIRKDLKYLKLPSQWGHDWKRFIHWAQKRDLIGAVTGIVGM